MKPSRYSSSTLLALLLTMSLPMTSFAEKSDSSLLFEASFSGGSDMDQSLRARRAGGNPAPTLTPEGTVIEPDLVAHNGFLGVRVGPGTPCFAYESEGNLPAGKGTLALRLVAGRLGRAESSPWTLFAIESDTDSPLLRVERLPEGGFRVSGQEADGSPYDFSATEPPDSSASDTQLDLEYSPKTVRLLANGKVLGERSWSGAPQWRGILRIGPATHSRGEPALLANLRILSGTEVSAREKTAGLAPGQVYAGPPTPWWKADMPRLGLEALEPKRVPAPFTPIEFNGSHVSVWGRAYSVDGDSLLEQVVSSAQPLLEGHVTLLAASEGRTLEIKFGAPLVVSRAPGRLVLKRIGSAPGLTITALYTVEYDGMVWIELECQRTGKSSPDALSLIVPFQPTAAEYIQYVGAPHNYESQNLARNSNAMTLPPPGQSMNLGFKTHVWIGNTRAGLQWFSESDEGWWPLDRKDCIQIHRNQDGGARLTLHIQEESLPDAVGQIFRIRFGFMATPVKPMPEGWRGWTFTAQHGSPEAAKRRGNNVIYWPDEWRAMGLDPEPHRALSEKVIATRRKVRMDHKAGRKILPYWTRIHLPVLEENRVNPDAERMVALWGTEPNRTPGEKRDHRRLSMATAWADYLVWCFDQWGEEFGHADGIYLDETQPIPNTRKESNGGYVDTAGRRRPTFEFRGSRDYMKRIRYLAEKRNDTPARSMIHNSSTYCMPSMSEYSVFLSGEQMNSGYFQNDNPGILPSEEERAQGYYYCHVLPMDRLIAEGYSRQWGIPIAWLPQLKNQKDIMDSPVAARDLLSRLQQVDALIWPLFMNQEEAQKMLKFRQEFGTDAPDTEFIPYWENQAITANDANVKVGYYARTGKRLVIVSNFNRQEMTTVLHVPEGPNAIVTNAESGQAIPLVNQQIQLTIPRNDYRALLVTTPGAISASQKP